MRPVDINKTELLDLYVGKEKTIKVCANVLGVSASAIGRRLRKLGVAIRPPTRRLINGISDEQVVDLYCNQQLSLEQTAEILGCSMGLVRGRLKRLGVISRSLSEGKRLSKGTADIKDEQLVYLHDIRGWSCAKISDHFHKSADFARQRFILIGKARRNKIGKNNPAYIDGRTPLRTRIRDCAKSLAWKQACMERDNYICQRTGQHGGKLEIHHLKPFAQIFEEFLSLNSDLDPEKDCDTLFDLAQEYPPFWDIPNGVTLSAETHDELHAS